MIATDDGDLSDEQPVTVSVTDENDSPSIITGSSGSVENASASTVIYDADASDEDAKDSMTFSVSGMTKFWLRLILRMAKLRCIARLMRERTPALM